MHLQRPSAVWHSAQRKAGTGLHTSAMGQGVLMTADGSVQWCDNLPSVKQLATGSKGNAVYTTALINADAKLIDWQLHEERLLRQVSIANQDASTKVTCPIDGVACGALTSADMLYS
jgi:hypothetical protein